MRDFNIKAILLNKYKVSESDLSCILLTKEFGKISAWRKNAFRKTDNIDFFSVFEIGIYRFKHKNSINNLKILVPNLKIRTDIQKFENASFVLNFLNKITADETGGEFFDEAVNVLEKINDNNGDFLKEMFFLKILKIAGYEFVLNQCSCCGTKLDKKVKSVFFSVKEGGIVCNICKKNKNIDGITISGEVLEFLKGCLDFNLNLKAELNNLMNKIIEDLH